MQVLELDTGKTSQRRFAALTARVYATDPLFIPDTPGAAAAALADPAYIDRQAAFMVEQDGDVRARCVARLAEAPDTGTIGFFEALNDVEACRLLLAAAEGWLRSRGVNRVLGPMDGDTWHRYRFAVEPLQAAPFLKEPWNPAYYSALWEACGYTVADRYLSTRIVNPADAAANLAPYQRRIRRQGYTFRPLDASRLADELTLMYRLSVQIFAGNRHYTPIPLDSFLQLYDGIRPLLVPGLCQFCCAPDGSVAGFVFCYPDYADAVRAMRGRRDWLAKVRFLRGRRRATRVCIKSLGCLPAYRGTGVGPALMGLAFEQTVASGYGEALMCLMHEVNDSRRLDGGTSEPFRQYVLFEKWLVHAAGVS